MVIKEIVVSRSVRVNTGNFEGTGHFVSVKAEVDELDDEQAEHENLSRRAEQMMVRQLLRSYKVRKIRSMGTVDAVAKHHGLSWVPKE